jgi:dihydroxyacetone kinase-like predicted kinase
VHVHTDAPDRALQEGRGAGVVLNESITSLERQVAACLEAGRAGPSATPTLTGLVAVAEGAGLEAAFRSLGATVVTGGPGRNPSVGELVGAIRATAADAVIVLPNHPNVVPAARLALQESGLPGFVVKARSTPAGLAAAAAFVPHAGVDSNVRAMREAVAMSVAGEVAEATLAAQTPAGPVGVGDWVGTREGTVLEVGPDPAPVAIALVELFRRDRPDAEVLTVVLGDGAESDGPAGDPVVVALRTANGDLRIDALPGGQPRLRYLIGLE